MLPQYQIDAAKALGGQIQQDYLGVAAPGAGMAAIGSPTRQTHCFICPPRTQAFNCPTTPRFCAPAAAGAPVAQGAPGTIFTEWCTLPPGAAAPAAQGARGIYYTQYCTYYCTRVCPQPVAAQGAPGTVFTEWCTLPPGAAAPAAAQPMLSAFACVSMMAAPCPPAPAAQGAPGTIFTEWCTLPPGAAAPAVQGGAPGTVFTEWCTLPPGAAQGLPAAAQGAVAPYPTLVWCPPTLFCPRGAAAGAAQGGAPGTVFTEWCTLPPGAAAPQPVAVTANCGPGPVQTFYPPHCVPQTIGCTAITPCPTINPPCPVGGAQGAPGTIFTEWCTLPPGVAAATPPAAQGAPGTIFTEWCTLPPGVAAATPPAAQGAPGTIFTMWCTLPPGVAAAAPPVAQGAPGTVFTEWCTRYPGHC